jgi:hypothetical protein
MFSAAVNNLAAMDVSVGHIRAIALQVLQTGAGRMTRHKKGRPITGGLVCSQQLS